MTTILGIDGPAEQALLAGDGCCPPSICNITLCSLICNFVNALPRGPLWDRAKAQALDRAQRGITEPICSKDEPCVTLVNHAIYSANKLWHLLQDAIWPAIRESDPFTCTSVTVDDWLSRMGWVDCFSAACRDARLGDVTPLEVLVNGVATRVEPNFPADLRTAVKLGIVRSLARLDIGIVPNLDSINFVIEPLGAKVEHVGLSCEPWPCLPGCEPPDAGCAEPGDNSNPGTPDPCCPRCDHPVWKITHASTTLPAPSIPRCDLDGMLGPESTISASYTPDLCTDPAGLPTTIWPGVLAAECIVRSLVPPGTYLEIVR